MRRSLKIMIAKSISAVVGLGFLAMSSAQAATVSLTPSANTVRVGEAFTVHVDATAFDIATGGATLGVSYDPSLSLTGASASAGSPFGVPNLNPDDTVDFFVGLTDPLASGDFPVIDLQFVAVSESQGAQVTLIDQANFDLAWFDANFDPIPGINYAAANVNVNPVPLPAAVWMMLGGMGLLGWTGRRRRA
jgi:hypothetical protein